MSAIVPFDFSAPATRGSRRPNSINQTAILPAAGFPVLSIKGKVFALVKDGERRVLTRMIDDEEVPVSSMSLVVLRANIHARVFYGKAYVEGDSDGAKPMCFSHDGARPDAQAEAPQSKNCAMCPHSQWGTKLSADGQGKGTACTVNTRLAVADPKNPEQPILLRVPAGSRVNFSTAVKAADDHGKDYNEVVMRISFDQDAPSPKLVFKPNALLSDEAFAKVEAMYENSQVLDIVGNPSMRSAEEVEPVALPAPTKPKALPAMSEDDLDGVLSPPPAKPAAEPAKAAPASKRAAPKAAEPAKPAAPAPEAGNELLNELTSLLGSSDD